MNASLDSLAILVAASIGPQTGGEIQTQITADTLGHYVQASKLYYSLHRMEAAGRLVSNGKQYELTEAGRRQLKNNLRLIEELLRVGRSRLR